MKITKFFKWLGESVLMGILLLLAVIVASYFLHQFGIWKAPWAIIRFVAILFAVV